MANRITAVTAEPLGVERGLWCTRCLTSAGVRAWVAVILGDRMHLQSRARCLDCGSTTHLEG